MLGYILISFLLLAVGFINLQISLRKIVVESIYYNDFSNHYFLFLQSLHLNQIDYKEYQWLIVNSPKMQRNLGIFGVMSNFIDGRYQYRNLQILVNLLPQIREAYETTRSYNALSFDFDRLKGFTNVITESLLRYEGDLSERDEATRNRLKNPFIWFREGVQWVVTLPIQLLYWTGVINYVVLSRLSNNWFVKFLNFLIIIIGLASSIVTLVTGYNPFIEIMRKLK